MRLDGSEDHLAAQARILWRLGRSDKAVPIREDQRALAAKIYDGNILQHAIRLNNHATLYPDQGRNDGAKLALETAIAIICALHGPDHPDAQKYIAALAFIKKIKRD